jgi:hypothetical protein
MRGGGEGACAVLPFTALGPAGFLVPQRKQAILEPARRGVGSHRARRWAGQSGNGRSDQRRWHGNPDTPNPRAGSRWSAQGLGR